MGNGNEDLVNRIEALETAVGSIALGTNDWPEEDFVLQVEETIDKLRDLLLTFAQVQLDTMRKLGYIFDATRESGEKADSEWVREIGKESDDINDITDKKARAVKTKDVSDHWCHKNQPHYKRLREYHQGA